MITVHVRQRPTKNTNWEYYFNFKGKRYSKSGFKTKALAKREGAAEAAILEQKNEISEQEKREIGITDDITLREAFKQFYEIDGGRFKDNTLRVMKQRSERFLEPLMDKKLSELTYMTIQKHFNDLKDRGSVANKTTLKALNRVIKCCIRCGQIKYNPASEVEPGGVKRHNPSSCMTLENLLDLLNCIKNSNCSDQRKNCYSMALLSGYYLGLRIGEVMALNKDDFDLEKKTVSINKTLIYNGLPTDRCYIQSSPKTETSTENQIIPDAFIPSLKEWFEKDSSPLFVSTETGGYIHPKIFGWTMRNFARKKCGFEFHYHLLRHLYATTLYENGVDIKTAQALLRHKDVQVTLNVYTHLSKDRKREELNRIFDQEVTLEK